MFNRGTLFETSAEVLGALAKAFEDYRKKGGTAPDRVYLFGYNAQDPLWRITTRHIEGVEDPNARQRLICICQIA